MQTASKAPQQSGPSVCIIGAGPSGLTAAKNLQQQGITNITVFEKNQQIGGNWAYDESNEHSSVYETTHIISSRWWSEFHDYTMPVRYPDYPSHTQLLDYFREYAKKFNINQYIRLQTKVLKTTQTEDKKWLVVYEDSAGTHEQLFDYLLVANGHHWDPIMPSYPGHFSGEVLHSHQYKKAAAFKGKSVLVVGGGNSACDIAVEIAHLNSHCSISMRRGYHIFPKLILGKPTDVAFAYIRWLPRWLRQKIISNTIRLVQGNYDKYFMQKPDYGPLEAHPTINSELLYFVRHGKVKPKVGICSFDGNTVYFVDGTSANFDTIIYATGYRINFPFFDQDTIDFSNSTQVPLYRKMMHPNYETLYFIGLCQPQGCIWPLSDFQSQVVARIIAGTLKRPKNLPKKIAKELKNPHYRFKESTRHSIEVDFHKYKRELLNML